MTKLKPLVKDKNFRWVPRNSLNRLDIYRDIVDRWQSGHAWDCRSHLIGFNSLPILWTFIFQHFWTLMGMMNGLVSLVTQILAYGIKAKS